MEQRTYNRSPASKLSLETPSPSAVIIPWLEPSELLHGAVCQFNLAVEIVETNHFDSEPWNGL